MFGLAAVQQTTGELFSPGALERGLNSRLTTSTETSPITGSGISETAPTARTTRTNPHSTVERHSARRSRSGWLRYASMERKNTSATSTQKQKHAEPTLRASLRRLKPHRGALRPRRPQNRRGRLPEPHSGLFHEPADLEVNPGASCSAHPVAATTWPNVNRIAKLPTTWSDTAISASIA